MPILVTDDLVQRLTTDQEVIQAAETLSSNCSLLNQGVSVDGTWILGECQGSGKHPYQISVDFIEENNPTLRCNCPSRKSPCKHAIGLLLSYRKDPSLFTNREPSMELLAKREKKQAIDDRKKGIFPKPGKKTSKDAQSKKLLAQKEGLELLEKILVDMVSLGQWYEASRLEKLDRHAKQLSEAHLPGAMHVVKRLVLLGQNPRYHEEEKLTIATDLIGQLWAMVQKAHQYMDNKSDADENSPEATTVMEEILGHNWMLSELKAKGFCHTSLDLLELAFERTDDEARTERIEISNLMDISTGKIHQAIAYRPFKGLNQIPEQPSYQSPIHIPEAAIYPGYVNCRIRWEKGSEIIKEDSQAALSKAYSLAIDLKAAFEQYRSQVKHPLSSREVVVLIRCEKIGKIGDKVILEDAQGTRIQAVDKSKDYSNVANLVRAAGELGREKPSVLVRMFLQPIPKTVVALPLAIFTPKKHLRLGI